MNIIPTYPLSLGSTLPRADFTFLDFIQLIPKLGAVLTSAYHGVVNQEKANVHASGYLHTYFDTCSLDLVALKTYPSESKIDEIAIIAHEEAVSLLKALDATSSLFTGMFTAHELTWWVEHDDEDSQDDGHTMNDNGPSISTLMTDIGSNFGHGADKRIQALGLATVATNFQIQAQLTPGLTFLTHLMTILPKQRNGFSQF
ncbi:uncharacterized protein EI90DRAFT_3017537 [Cantharellus anzutake]|uniref:uncharacterized protein n=1 Tax=Cantharellus anzutake TaxID=1750568 RepID=UPI001907E8B2|nr:uncharacterized protein EI90DRAFT_3017537 [Cantharellus anzutake]KAF8328672.1 hypothetical protein EI90DRAFT_3017537 [Cantharellus anzutake]